METFERNGMMPSDLWGVVANVVQPDKHLRLGAKVWLVQPYGGSDRGSWMGISRGGRLIDKWVDHRRLGHFRAAWIPPALRADSPRIGALPFQSKAAAESQAAWYREHHGGTPATHTLDRELVWRDGCRPKAPA